MAFLALPLATSLCAAEPQPRRSARESIVGTWGLATESGGCTSKPHTISFSDDGSELYLRYTDPPGQATYAVMSEGPSHLRLAMRGERTQEGKPAQWDLVLLAADAYTWHRADWPEGHRTWPVRRCAAVPAAPEASATDAVLERERRFNAALVERDEIAFGRLLADDLVHVGFEGQLTGKAEYMAFFTSGVWRYLEYRPSQVAVKHLGGAAVVTGRVDRIVRLDEREATGAFAFTHVWTLVANEWLLTSSHVTPIPAGAAVTP